MKLVSGGNLFKTLIWQEADSVLPDIGILVEAVNRAYISDDAQSFSSNFGSDYNNLSLIVGRMLRRRDCRRCCTKCSVATCIGEQDK